MNGFSFKAIGTSWHIDLPELNSIKKQSHIQKKILERIELFDKTYSRFRQDSLITSLTQRPGAFIFPADAHKLFEFYREIYEITNGLVTPLIGETLEDAGYDKTYSLIPQRKLRTPPIWDEVMDFQAPILTTKKSIVLDFGAAGKGYLIDIICELLLQEGITSFTVDAGGDIRNQSIHNKPLRIGLENPSDLSQAIGVITLYNQSICGSAGNRRSWNKFHHIINPKTLSSPTNISAIWVIADSTLIADGVATCLFFTSPEKLLLQFNFDYLILYADSSIKKSAKFQAELFTI